MGQENLNRPSEINFPPTEFSRLKKSNWIVTVAKKQEHWLAYAALQYLSYCNETIRAAITGIKLGVSELNPQSAKAYHLKQTLLTKSTEAPVFICCLGALKMKSKALCLYPTPCLQQ